MQEPIDIVDGVLRAVKSVKNPLFFKTERGYQAELYYALKNELQAVAIPPMVFEVEAQKRDIRHHTTLRPDIILHVPATSEEHDPRKDNYIVFELKLRGSARKASEDYSAIDEIIDKLAYRLAFFININSSKHFLNQYSGPNRQLIHAVCVRLNPKGLVEGTHAYYDPSNELVEVRFDNRSS